MLHRSGASWVSIHNGGGVGIGYRNHAGQVIVADAHQQWPRASNASSPTIPHRRRAPRGAGYPEAIDFAPQIRREIPMK